jgi:hypothetical protein
MRFHRDYVRDLPDEMTVWMVIRKAPPLPFLLNLHTRWREASDDKKCLSWAKEMHTATQPFAKGVYVNFLSHEGEDRVKEAYTPEEWQRLVNVKKKWDPNNLFRINQNIRP